WLWISFRVLSIAGRRSLCTPRRFRYTHNTQRNATEGVPYSPLVGNALRGVPHGRVGTPSVAFRGVSQESHSPRYEAMPALKLEILEGDIALLTLDQPDSRANVLSQAMQGELEAGVAELKRHGNVQGLVFRSGKPGMFIAGADLKELGSARPD